jgi:hypothetical protein
MDALESLFLKTGTQICSTEKKRNQQLPICSTRKYHWDETSKHIGVMTVTRCLEYEIRFQLKI